MKTSRVADSSSWRDLFDLAKREDDDRRGLGRELRAWAQRRGVTRAVLFADGEDPADGLERLAVVGNGLPERADEADADPRRHALRRLELPGVVALYDAGTGEVEAAGDLEADLLPILAGVRISQLKQQIKRQSFQAMFRGVELEALYEVGLAIASTLDLEQLGEEVLVRALLLLDARRGALYLLDPSDVYRRTSQMGGEARAELERSAVDEEALRAGDGGVPDDLLPGARHLLAAPVELDGDARGLLVVADKESRKGVGPFPPNDRRTLSLFANQAAIALENAKLHRYALEKERLEREMELAAEIQQQILPDTMPEIPGHEVLGWNRPARQVGGDYFGFQTLDDGRRCLVVGDVTGKGMPASLLVSTLHSALRVLLDRTEVGPALVERLNRHICESSGANKFITLILAILVPETSELAYINAGHNPGVVLGTDGSLRHLDSSGLPLGLMPSGSYDAETLQLDAGDLVCLYSDGITECEAPDEEQYGLDRLVDLLREHRDDPLDEILAAIDRAMLAWADGQPQGDDQTVVLLRRSRD